MLVNEANSNSKETALLMLCSSHHTTIHIKIPMCMTQNMLIYSKAFPFQLQFDGSIVKLSVAFVNLSERLMTAHFFDRNTYLLII